MNDMTEMIAGFVIGVFTAGCFFVLFFISIDTAQEYYECKHMELVVKELHKYTDKEINCWMMLKRIEGAEAFNVVSEEDNTQFFE